MFKSVRHSFSFSTLVENIIIFMFPGEQGIGKGWRWIMSKAEVSSEQNLFDIKKEILHLRECWIFQHAVANIAGLTSKMKRLVFFL